MAKKLWHNLLRSTDKTYYIRGTSSNVGGTETFKISFIRDESLWADAATLITCDVDENGNWNIPYRKKAIYSLQEFVTSNSRTTVTSIDFADADDFERCVSLGVTNSGAFQNCSVLTNVSFAGKELNNVTGAPFMFYGCRALTSVNLSSATFKNCYSTFRMFQGCSSLTNIDLSAATFEKLSDASLMFLNCSTISSVNISKATFESCTTTMSMFSSCSNLQTILFKPGITLSAVKRTDSMFSGCASLQTADLSSATFENCTKAGDTNAGMYHGCGLPTIDLSNAVFGNASSTSFMFYGCAATSILLPKATFANSNDCFRMFQNCRNLTILNLPFATFAATKTTQVMFTGCPSLTQLQMPEATFEKVENANSMFDGCRSLATLSMPKATFEKATNTTSLFSGCSTLSTLDVPQNSTAILPTSVPTYTPINLSVSPLNYASMLKIANWLSNLTPYPYASLGTRTESQFNNRGAAIWYTYDSVNDVFVEVQSGDAWIEGETYYVDNVHTCTFKTSAWNALTQTEKDNIDAILTAKNWVRAIA